MKVQIIDSKSLPIIEYKHIHDSKISFRKYRENFNFGLTVNQYYFDKTPKDKKTNFNTQYTLTDAYSLSTIAELNIPFTTNAVSTFTTTIQQGVYYLKTDYTTDITSISSDFVASSQFTDSKGLSSQFFFTFTVSSVGLNQAGKNREDLVSISQTYNSVTYYLSAPEIQDTTAKWTDTGPSYFRYTLDNNKITIHNESAANILVNSSNSWYWKAPGSWQSTITDLDDSFFDINRNLLTKDFKTILNNFSKYKSNYNSDTVALNTATPVNNNYFVFNNNYNYYQNNKENKFIAHADFFPLKNQATLHEYYSENNHYNYEDDTTNRVYEKINAGTHQQHGYPNIGLSYNIGTYDMEFKPNKLTYFTTPNSMSPYTVLNINDSKIENLGATPGSNPLMSDKVFKRREIIKNNTFSDAVNPMYLCSWLSGNIDGDTKWVDRYYNPLASNFSEALSGTSHYRVITAAGAETTETFDVSSSLTFEPNNDYGYYHIGDQDYENLFKAFDSVYTTTIDTEYLSFKGIPLPETFIKKDREIILDGTTFAKNKTNVQGDFSINFWMHTKNNNIPFCYKIMGNSFSDDFDQGISIFNTDLVTPNIILPVVNKTNKNNLSKKYTSKLIFLNNDFEIYDFLIIKEGQQEVEIDGIARKDNFSEFYVLAHTTVPFGDGEKINNKKKHIIYVYNNNNNLISKIEDLKELDINADLKIDDFEVDEDKLYVLFNPIDEMKYFTYDIKNNTSNIKNLGNISYKSTKGKKGKIIRKNDEYGNKQSYIFEVDDNGFGNEVAFDSNNVPFTIQQDDPTDINNDRNHLRKGTGTDDKNKILSGLDKRSSINSVLIDDEDNVIVLHDKNTISILDNNRKLIRTREFCDSLNKENEISYIDLIYDFEGRNYKKYILFLQEFKHGVGFRLIKIDPTNLTIVDSKMFKNTDIGRLDLTKTITAYSYLKKTGANKKRVKIVLSKTPKFSSAGVLYKTKSIIDFDITKLNPGYNHFFINVSLTSGFMCLFINGKLIEKVKFSGVKYALNNILGTGVYIGAVSTPYYLTLANRLLQPRKYFVHNTKIKGFKIYNKTMNYFDILAHYNYHMKNKNVIWSYPLGQRTYIDTIDKLIKFNYPEKLSNKFNINIKNTGLTDQLLIDKIQKRIVHELRKITPYFDEAEQISIS